MKLEVTYDFVCPWCYLGLTQLSRAITTAQSTDPEVTTWPFQLMPELPATGVDNAQFVVNLLGKERAAQMLLVTCCCARQRAGDAAALKTPLKESLLACNRGSGIAAIRRASSAPMPRLRINMAAAVRE
jgi:predicted DsbA family dithiol-disulfide isomerase